MFRPTCGYMLSTRHLGTKYSQTFRALNSESNVGGFVKAIVKNKNHFFVHFKPRRGDLMCLSLDIVIYIFTAITTGN